MSRVLIVPREVAEFVEQFRAPLDAVGLEVVTLPPAEANLPSPEELSEALRGVEAVIAGSEPYTWQLLAAHPQLRVIARSGVGYDSIDVAAASALGIVVTIAPGTNQDSVAEHTFALILAWARHVPARHAALAAGGWNRLLSRPLRGRTLGLLGLGRTGKAVALRAVAFGMRVLAHDLHPDLAFCAAHGVVPVPFEQLLAESDYLSLHVPLGPETRNLFDHRTLARMKPGAVLINTSRGKLVCEADLVEALRRGHLAGAALDVFEQEPLSPDSPLRQLPNVVLTPHAAGVDEQSLVDMARSAAEAIAALRRGEWPNEKIVNPGVRPIFQW